MIYTDFSKIEKLCFKGLDFFIKREDLLGKINGNKARKLSFYLKQSYPENQRFISFGSAQSNALAALSIFCSQRAFKLLFVCEKIPSFLKQNPCGNYALSLENGTQIVENLVLKHRRDLALSLKEENDIFIEEGIASKEAELGYIELAKEIEIQSEILGRDFDIFLPSGTGTSAAFLAKHSKFRVFTCPCVGDALYLKRQILALEPDYDFSNLYILRPPKKYHFAKPHSELITLYKQLKLECGIEFDLLYDMVGFKTLLEHKDKFKNLLYIHQGGILGNQTMLRRYEFRGLL